MDVQTHIQSKNLVHELILKDAETLIEYKLKVNSNDFKLAHKDPAFAAMLLQNVKLQTSDSNKICVNSSLAKANNIKYYNVLHDDFKATVVETDPNSTQMKISGILESDKLESDDFYDTDPDDPRNAQNAGSSKFKVQWTHASTLLLIFLYKEHCGLLDKHPHKLLWDTISKLMKERNYNFSARSCSIKFDSLKRRYRQVIDHNAQSGNNRKDWQYLEILDDIFKTKKWVTPLSVAGSNIIDTLKPLRDRDNSFTPNKRKRKSNDDEKTEYLKLLIEEKRLRREQNEIYKAKKLKLLSEFKEILKKKEKI
ncbi:uncharacterized protein [Prorops nasuta]|uniref:uncharacterized protein isoform X1 n=1 Tax=Prorops nasuta TaxID=863751 RepID=UPI0034CD509C